MHQTITWKQCGIVVLSVKHTDNSQICGAFGDFEQLRSFCSAGADRDQSGLKKSDY